MNELIDLGCHPAVFLEAIPAAGIVLLVFLMLSALGSAVGGVKRWIAADVITGWGFFAASDG
jgi:hypothetical protein